MGGYTGAVCVGITLPPLLMLHKRFPPIIGGWNWRWHVGITPPLSSAAKKEKPLEQGGVLISHHLVLAVARKNLPQMIGGIKKLKQSGVWVAHCSFTSGRPNEMVCGMHTTSLAYEMALQKGGGTNASSLPPPPPWSFPFLFFSLALPSSLPHHSHLSSMMP